MGNEIRLAIIDDHGLVVAGFAALLPALEPAILVTYSGTSVEEFLAAADPVEVVLLDVELGPDNPTAAEAVTELVARGIPTILVSALPSGLMVRAALESGASAYLSKQSPPEQLVEVIRQVAAGEQVLTPETAQVLMDSRLPELSDRELQVLRLYAAGMPLKSVARRLSLSEHTCTEYLNRVRWKYAERGREVRTKQQLLGAALNDQIIAIGDLE